MVTIALFTSQNYIQTTELYIMMKTKFKGTFIHATLNRGDAFQRVSYLLRHRIYVNGPGVF